MGENDAYDADWDGLIERLEGLDCVRAVPGMYVGDVRDGSGLLFAVETLLYPALDEHLAGRCDRVDVTLCADGSVEIRAETSGYVRGDYGEVFPGATQLATLRGGSARSDRVRFGRFFVGVAVSNAVASRFSVTYPHGGRRWNVAFSRGRLVTVNSCVDPLARESTVVRFTPDPTIFGSPWLTAESLLQRVRGIAYALPGLTMTFNAVHRPGPPTVLCFRDGVADLVRARVDAGAVLSAPFAFSACEPDGSSSLMRVEVALQWSAEGSGFIVGITNGVQTNEGGAHVVGLQDALAPTLAAYAAETGHAGSSAWITREVVTARLDAVVSVWHRAPRYSAATRQRLISWELAPIIKGMVQRHLYAWLKAHPEEAQTLIKHLRDEAKEQEEIRLVEETLRLRERRAR
ncbi:MAG: hypothetical protein R3A52_06445 [Polyangiales bacterium]